MCKMKQCNQQSERQNSTLKKAALWGSKMHLEVTPAMQSVFCRPCSLHGTREVNTTEKPVGQQRSVVGHRGSSYTESIKGEKKIGQQGSAACVVMEDTWFWDESLQVPS